MRTHRALLAAVLRMRAEPRHGIIVKELFREESKSSRPRHEGSSPEVEVPLAALRESFAEAPRLLCRCRWDGFDSLASEGRHFDAVGIQRVEIRGQRDIQVFRVLHFGGLASPWASASKRAGTPEANRKPIRRWVPGCRLVQQPASARCSSKSQTC